MQPLQKTFIEGQILHASELNDITGKVDELVNYANTSGSRDKNEIVQVAAARNWVIDHGLNKFPSVTTIDSNGYEVFGDVEYISLSRVVIRFDASFSGKAILN